jgi:outer membrane protein assembly factor BamB
LISSRKLLVCALAIGIIAPVAVFAEHTRTWRESDFSEFERGTPNGVAIRSDGKLMPAPKFTPFADPNLAYLWALRMDSQGRIYAAGGSNAKVLRLDDPAKPTTVFESGELAAQAITFDSHDNLYVGTSPDGKVYKVTPDGEKSTFFDPKTKYIWALAFDAQGTLFVATGDKGEVFAVTPDGKGQLFYQSDERHARSIAFDQTGNLLIGTDPNGLVLRIAIVRKNSQAMPGSGPAFVVYETSKKEVTSLLTDDQGNIYAASIGEKQRGATTAPILNLPPPSAQPQAAPTPQANVSLQLQAQSVQPNFAFPFISSLTGGAEVIKISADGSPETLWSSREDLVFAMGLSSSRRILLGTGNKGTILSLDGNNVFSSIAKTASAQVTSLIAGRDGKIFVATANPGKIFTLGPGYERGGSFESDTFDAKIFSHWGRLSWWGDNAAQGKVEFYVRSGNTSSPQKNWSPWVGPFKNPAGETVDCPPARFVQWKAVFVDADNGSVPDVSWVNLAYQPKNVAPAIDDIAIQDPGIRVQGFAPQSSGPATPASVQLRMPQRNGTNFPAPTSSNPDLAARPLKIDVPPQGFEEKGYASVLWSAHDDNDDDLVYSVYYHGEGEKNWRLLKGKLTQKYYSWDTTTMPDGAYYLKIVASDSPSNPMDQALTNERESDRFEIENTPPRIENLRADASAAVAKVTFEGISSSSAIAKAQYSVDAGDWTIAFPDGLLSDAPKESYQIPLSGLSAGEHTVAVQIADRFDNSAAAKVTFTVAARR